MAKVVKADIVKAGVLAVWWLGRLLFEKTTDIIASKVADKITKRKKGW